jgi:molecular chaperone DnaK
MQRKIKKNQSKSKRKTKQIRFAIKQKKQLEELGSKIETTEKEKVESLITQLEAAIQTDDITEIKSISENVKQVMMEIGQKVYSQADATDGNATTDDPIETDFSVGQ